MSITEMIRTHLKNNAKNVDWTKFSDNDSLWEDGILDSFGMIAMLGFIEKTFHITVANDDLSPDNFDSINRISRYITRNMTTS